MEEEPFFGEELGHAKAGRNEWVGSLAGDEDHDHSLYDLVGVDPGAYRILRFELFSIKPGHTRRERLIVWVTPREGAGFEQLHERAKKNRGFVDVYRIEKRIPISKLVDCFKRLSIVGQDRLGVRDQGHVLREVGSLPGEGDLEAELQEIAEEDEPPE